MTDGLADFGLGESRHVGRGFPRDVVRTVQPVVDRYFMHRDRVPTPEAVATWRQYDQVELDLGQTFHRFGLTPIGVEPTSQGGQGMRVVGEHVVVLTHGDGRVQLDVFPSRQAARQGGFGPHQTRGVPGW